MVVKCQSNLSQMVAALGAASGSTSGLDGWEQKSQQHADYRQRHQ
jgi:hypothetical protein